MRAPLPRVLVGVTLLTSLSGCSDQGFATLDVTDTFLQPDTQLAADVLFVIDDSASMAEEQARIASNFGAFLSVLPSTDADYQLGVVTTDVTDPATAGILRGGILRPDDDDLEARFTAAVVAGTRGARDEAGLAAALLAAAPGQNPGFLRPEARFHVVFVSDEDDHSPLTVPEYVDRLKALGGDGGFAAHALVGDLPQGCSSGTSAADPGQRYLEAAEATEGFRESICSDDYADLLVRVGLDVGGTISTFPLSRLPSADTLEVEVDGVRIPERAQDGWAYSVGQNAVVFDGRSIPRPGMSVAITYMPWLGAPPDDAEEADSGAAP
jgi:hypothetical protein